ncbi:hypothetical protein [Acinetobacter courvalinii]|uniref:hypothetical protein n=1 Tax=Acinetobacter courvalinii TaxID=280147 RepID=UPI0039C9EF24
MLNRVNSGFNVSLQGKNEWLSYRDKFSPIKKAVLDPYGFSSSFFNYSILCQNITVKLNSDLIKKAQAIRPSPTNRSVISKTTLPITRTMPANKHSK